MTTAPAAAIFGDHSFDTAPPADIRQMSVPAKSKVSSALRTFASVAGNLSRLVAERDLRVDRAGRGDGNHLVGREAALGQDVEHLAAHVARGTDDGNLETHDGETPDRVRGRLAWPAMQGGVPALSSACLT